MRHRIPNHNAKCRDCGLAHQCRAGIAPVFGPCSFPNKRELLLMELKDLIDKSPRNAITLRRSVTVSVDDLYGPELRKVSTVSLSPRSTRGRTILNFGDSITSDDLETEDIAEILHQIKNH